MTSRPYRVSMAAAVGLLFASTLARANIAGFGDFSQFTINRLDAAAPPSFPSPGTIELVNGGNEARSVFANVPQSVTAFTASFTYQVLNPNGNAGAAFVLQNDPQGALAVGSGNHALSGITKSVEVTFNVGNGNSGLFTGGNADGTGTNVSPVDFASGHPIDVQFIYAGSALTETLLDTVTSQQFTTTRSVSIGSAVGGTTAFVGLTAGSGSGGLNQRFSDFQFTTPGTPEPAVMGIVAVLSAGLIKRQRVTTPARPSQC